jgi:hypothetical protein
MGRMDVDHARPADLDGLRAAFGAEFGFTNGDPGFAGWVEHWAAHKPWFDANEVRIMT